MAATADLPPGARSRMWVLIALTLGIGVGTYAVFGRTIILVAGGMALSVLLYLLLGLELQLRKERAELEPIVVALTRILEPRGLWAVLAANGTVLKLTEAGCRALGHTADVLTGQQLGDLLPRDPGPRVAFVEMMRFASAGQVWRGELELKDDRGRLHRLQVETMPIEDSAARRQGLVALTGQAA